MLFKLLVFTMLLFIHSCSYTQLILSVNFPKSSPILTNIKKQELKKNIAIKNADLFTEEEIKELFGELEIEIK